MGIQPQYLHNHSVWKSACHKKGSALKVFKNNRYQCKTLWRSRIWTIKITYNVKNPNSTEKFDVRVTSNYQSITRKFPIKEKLLEMIDSSKKTKENSNMIRKFIYDIRKSQFGRIAQSKFNRLRSNLVH